MRSCSSQVVATAVAGEGRALRYAGATARGDPRTVLAAVAARRGGGAAAFRFATPNLRSDRRVAMDAVRHCGLALKWTSEALRADREVGRKTANE